MKKAIFLAIIAVLFLPMALLADTAEFRTIVAQNPQAPGGELRIDVQVRITEGVVPQTMNSFTCDFYYSGDVTYLGVSNWAISSALGYARVNSSLVYNGLTYIRLGATGNGVNENGGGDPAGLDFTGDWQRLVTLRFTINNPATAASFNIRDQTNCFATFNNLHNDPYWMVHDFVCINQDLGTVALTSGPAPSITSSASTLEAFSALTGEYSPVQSYRLTGAALTTGVTITAPASFTVSKDNVNWANSVTLTPTSGAANSPIFVRFMSTTAGYYTGTITNVSGTASASIGVSGTAYTQATQPPVLSNATGITTNAFTIAWTNASGAVCDLEYATNPAFTGAQTQANAVSPVTLSGLTANATYFVRVKANTTPVLYSNTAIVQLARTVNNTAAPVIVTVTGSGSAPTAEITFGAGTPSPGQISFQVNENRIPADIIPDAYEQRVVRRWIAIEPQTNNGSLSFTFVFHYTDAEALGLNEANLVLYGYWSGFWHRFPGTVDTDNNTVTATGLNHASDWLVFDETTSTLPVELSSFSAIQPTDAQFVTISWQVQSETNMLGYNILRSNSGSFDDATKINTSIITAENSASGANYTYQDSEVTPQTYYYWLEAQELDGSIKFFGPSTVDVRDNGSAPVVNKTMLVGNYPNPFNPETTVRFTVKTGEVANLTIYNTKGQIVKTFKGLTPDRKEIKWDGLNDKGKKTSSGVYLYRLSSASCNEYKKMLLLK